MVSEKSNILNRLTRQQLEHISQYDLLAYLGVPFVHPGGFAATKKLLELCGLESGDTVLDIGCGTGTTPCHEAKKYGCTVVGLDLNTWMLARSKEKIARRNLGESVHLTQGDASRLPFREGSFDVAVAESVLYLLARETVFEEIKRVLKPQGRIGAIEFAWSDSPSEWLADEISRLRKGHTFSTLTHEEWRTSFLNAGFQEIKSEFFEARKVSYLEVIREEGGNSLNLLRRFLRIPPGRQKKLRRGWGLQMTSKELGYGVYCWKR